MLYFGGEVLHIIHSRSVTVIRSEIRSYSIPSYYGLMYIGQTQTVFGTTFARNTGIFLEGPSWGSFLWPAFFAEVLVKDKIMDATAYPDIQELLAFSDVLITDYSSCMFDSMAAHHAVFLFAKDVEDYTKRERGLLFDFHKLPCSLAETEDELLKNIATI